MFNSNDIYTHLMNGGNKQDLYVSLEKEIAEAEKKVATAKEAEQKEKELAEKREKGRAHAVQVLKVYFSLVNPDITEDIINSVLDTLESVEIKVNDVKGKYDEEWKEVWNFLFPFNFKKK